MPDWLALPLAGGLAAVAVVIAIAWSSETLAAIGLLGAALAPALQAIGTGLSWPSVAFAVIILGATVVLAVPRRWHELLIGIGVVVGGQVALLALDADASAGQAPRPSSPRSCWSCSPPVSGCSSSPARRISIRSRARRARCGRPRAPPRAAALGRRQQPGLRAAGAAVVWAGAWLALRRVQPALALVLGVSSLSLAAVATADLLSGTSLAITWAAEALLLSFVALRVRDARLQATALVYCAIAAAHVLLVDAPPKLIFEEPVPGMAAASVAALAFALLGAGILAPAEAVARTETGLLAWLAPLRVWLAAHRVGLQEGLVLAGFAASTYAVAILLTATRSAPVTSRPRSSPRRLVPLPWRSRRDVAPSSSSRRRSPGSAACSQSPRASMCPSSPLRRSTARTAAGR